MADNRPIGLFDSGVGGLSVLKEVKKLLPLENFIFLADQAHVPYGAKTKKQLNILSERIAKYLIKFDIKMLIIACNTASCYSIGFLRKKFKLQIIGTVPAIKPAIKFSKKGNVTIMSTPATAKSTYLKNLVHEFAHNKKVLKLGCAGLEDAVETLDEKNINKLLDKYTNSIKLFGSDVIILGCTHFPFLKNDIKKRFETKIKIIDSGLAIAKRTKSLLKEKDLLSSKKRQDKFFTTLNPKLFSQVASTLLKYKVVSKKAII